MKRIILAGFILSAGAALARGATIVMTNSDALGTASFNTGLNWANGAAPTGGNAYLTSTFLLRTPLNAVSLAFAGGSLEVQSGGSLRDKTAATITVTNLFLDDNATCELTEPNNINNNTAAGILAGGITLNGTAVLHAGISTDVAGETFTISSIIGGTGGLTTTGSTGTIILTATNNYSGGTTVNGGTVLVNGVLANSSVTISSGMLGGNGTIKAAVTNSAGGTLQPGLGGVDTSTLTISNNLVLAGTTVMELNRTNTQKSAKIAGISMLTQGGTLTVTNVGTTLQSGDSFLLFNAASYAGSFSVTNLPVLTSGLAWSNSLSVNGSVTVVTTTVPVIAAGTWTNNASSVWSATTNWSGGIVANGTGSNADFSTINITADRTVTLDSSRNIGNLLFGDTSGSQNWFLNSSGGSVLTLAVAAGSPTITVNNNSATINLPLAGTQGLAKAGSGMAVLSGINTYSGATIVNAGTLSLSSVGGGGTANTATMTVGNVAGTPAVLNILPGANVTNYNLVIGANATAPGAVFQSGGTFTQAEGANIADFRIGDATSGYGYYQLSGGTLNVQEVGIGGGNGGNATVGVMDITGGTFNDTGWITIGRGGTTSSGVLNVFGNGVVQLAGNTGKIGIDWAGSSGGLSVINIFNGGMINGPAIATYVLDLASGNTAGTMGVVNLGSNGTLAIGGVAPANANPVTLLDFNGGTLKATINNAAFMTSGNIDGVYIYPGGATIDDGGFTIAGSVPLQSPAGYGVSSIAVTSGGSGYIGTPLVTITGGSGIGATASAQVNFASGTVTNILVSNPGSGYASGDTLTVAFTGGGGTGAVAGTPVLAANTSGGLTKPGAGTLTLSGANTYTGGTTVSSGTLALGAGGSFASTNITVAGGATLDVSGISFALGANQSLSGSGTVTGSVSTISSSKIYAGTDGTYGTNTFNNNLTFVSGASAYFDFSSTASGANDQIIMNGAGSVLTCGDASIGIKCGATLDQANDYLLFNLTGGSAGIVGNFNATPVWTGTTPANAANYFIVTAGNNVILHYNSGTTNLPAVTNLAASAISATTATLNGQVLSSGGQTPTVKIYYGTSNGGTNPAAWTTNMLLGLKAGAFSGAISNLTGSTTYYFAASASNSAGTAWAVPSQSFTTPAPNVAVLTNLAATGVQGNSAILKGQVLSSGSQTPVVTLYYGSSNGGTNVGAWANSIYIGSQGGSYSYTISGLSTNTTYYFSAAGVNNSGTAWASPSLSFVTPQTGSAISVLTYHYDNSRTGANTNEMVLTPSIVNTNNFGLLTKYAVDGYVYTEPLYVPNLVIPGQGTHNVVFVATEHDSVYAFDADGNLGTNGGMLWHTNFGVSAVCANQNEFGARYCGNCYPDIVPEVGVTGTPVIDPVTGTIFLDVFTREVVAGVSTNYFHRIHALNITNGMEQSYSPVVVGGSVPGTGRDSSGGVMTFNPKQNNERPALTLAGGILYVAYAGYADTDPYHGWVIGYNAANLAPLTNYIFNSTPNATTNTPANGGFGVNAAEGGVWMGGNGLCVDANTNIYFETGNGSFSANTNGGDYADSFIKLSTTSHLALSDYFTPYNQAALASADTDLGACGPVLLPDSVGSTNHPHLIVGTGKSGTLYLVDRDSMGHYNTISANDTNIVQSVIGATASTWSSPAYFNNQIYLQPSSAAMKAFTITNGHVATPASSTATASFGTYNGGPVVSANGTNNGIVWVLNGASGTGTGALYAYNATNIAQQLYNSSQLSRDIPGNGIKMTTPTVANGKVYVGAQYALAVYGLTTFVATPVISPNGGSFTNLVTVALSDATAGASIYYTLDGTAPTSGSTLYTGAFDLTSNAVVQAVGIAAGAVNSGVAVASFVNTAAAGNGVGLMGQYWTNTASGVFTNLGFATLPTLTRTDAAVNFNWTANGPDPAVGRTNYAVLWTGAVQAQYDESYTFTTIADDGVRLWVNGQLLVNDWNVHTAAATNSGSITLNAQQLYNIRMEYFQNTGNAVVQLMWNSPSTPLQVVPQTQLYTYTNPPPTVILSSPADGSVYTSDASVTVGADADAPYNPVSRVDFYADTAFLGSVSNVPYTLTATGLGAGGYALTAVATDGSGLSSTSAPVSITVNAGSGQPYGLTNNAPVSAFLNMPTAFTGTLPALLSGTGAFSDTPGRIAAAGLIPYAPNTPLWSDAAVKSRYMALPNNGGNITPDEQINFLPTNSWTFPAGTVFVKNFDLVVNETNMNVPLRRLETRLLVRDINGAVYGVTYKWRADNSDADLLSGSLNEDILITNATGVRTQTWYYPSPSDCLTCHTPAANYVLGVNARQLNGGINYPATGVTDNQLRTLNRLGLFNPAFDESAVTNFEKLSALTNSGASLEERARSYLDANCAQCHRPGGAGITFDARYDTPLADQHITNYPASVTLGLDNARIVKSKDIWRSVIYARMNSVDQTIKMPPLARSLVDTNALQVMGDWINSLPGTPALAPPLITPNGGSFIASAGVTLTAPDTNATVYYTLDGTPPTTNSFPYSGVFNLRNNATVMAAAFETNFDGSIAAGALFFVQPLNFTSLGYQPDGQFQMGFAGVAGDTYVLQATTNFVDWTSISTNTAATNFFILTDPNASNFLNRFYRVQLQ